MLKARLESIHGNAGNGNDNDNGSGSAHDVAMGQLVTQFVSLDIRWFDMRHFI